MYEELQKRYQRGWCTKSQLKRFVEFERITPREYKLITGESYE